MPTTPEGGPQPREVEYYDPAADRTSRLRLYQMHDDHFLVTADRGRGGFEAIAVFTMVDWHALNSLMHAALVPPAA